MSSFKSRDMRTYMYLMEHGSAPSGTLYARSRDSAAICSEWGPHHSYVLPPPNYELHQTSFMFREPTDRLGAGELLLSVVALNARITSARQ